MTMLNPMQVAEIKARIAAKYNVARYEDADLFLVVDRSGNPIGDNDHDDFLDAEAEMESFIQKDLEAELEARDEPGDPNHPLLMEHLFPTKAA
jgi:hypothetical protein